MKERQIREEFIQCRDVLEDLFQSGLASVQENMVEKLRIHVLRTRQYGLEWLSKRLTEFGDLLEKRRHAIQKTQDDTLCALFCRIENYLETGIRQTGKDEAGVLICRMEWEQENDNRFTTQ